MVGSTQVYVQKSNHALMLAMGTYDPFTLHGTGTGTGERLVSILRYVLYTLHRDREPLFSIVPAPFFPVPVPVPFCHHAQMLECRQLGTGSTPPPFKPIQLGPHFTGTPWICSNHFTLDVTVEGPPSSDMFKRVYYVAHVVNK